MNAVLLVLELPIAYFLIYFSIGLKEHVIAIYEESPYDIFLTKVCATFFLIYMLNIVLSVLMKIIIRFRFNFINFIVINGICLLFMILLIATYKLLTNGYV